MDAWFELIQKKRKKPNKGKRFRSPGGTSYGQAGKAKDGKDRIRPGTKKEMLIVQGQTK